LSQTVKISPAKALAGYRGYQQTGLFWLGAGLTAPR